MVPPLTADELLAPFPAPWVDRARLVVPAARWGELAAAVTEPRPVWLRAHTPRIDPAAALAQLAPLGATPGPWPEAIQLPPASRAAAVRHPLVEAGSVSLQSLSSQAAARALDPQPGERILDLCAAPGSKTAHLAALQGGGELVAVDVSRNRVFKLKANLERQGVQVTVRCADGVAFARRNPASFDRILVDAPCSGDGRFHASDPGSWERWSLRHVRGLASRQKALLHAALDAVRPGGVVVYSTCTLSPEENEGVLTRALKRYPDVRLEPLPELVDGLAPCTEWGGKAFPEALGPARRLLPGPRWDGFFVARLRRG